MTGLNFVSQPKLGHCAMALLCTLAAGTLATTAIARGNVALSSVALDAADDNRFFTRVGGTVRNDIDYDGLDPAQTYTATAQLFNMTTQAMAGEPTTVAFTPDAQAGKVSVELPMPQNRTEFNIDYVVMVALYDSEIDPANVEDSTALIKLDDVTNIDQTVQSHAIQGISIQASANGTQTLPVEGGKIETTVEMTNLVAGYPYTVWGQLLTPSGQATGIYASVEEYIPTEKNSVMDMTFDVPEGWDGIKLAATVGLYHKKRVVLNADGSLTWIEGAAVPVMIASDLGVDVAEQTVAVGVPFEDMPPVTN